MLVVIEEFFFFTDPATTEISTLSLHDALPICRSAGPPPPSPSWPPRAPGRPARPRPAPGSSRRPRSEEHTSELQSHVNLVCRLLLEKKNNHRAPPNVIHRRHSRGSLQRDRLQD